jgi:hypothetical protein
MPKRQAFIAAFIGSFALMFVGSGAVIVSNGSEYKLLAAVSYHLSIGSSEVGAYPPAKSAQPPILRHAC